ncbi:energy-coupling factor transporter transmembrane component T family protein [Paludibacterium purpuratum]|uniref:Energy-coupling factor transport system permease protein n=1 Tax=Paludibacterium purpuratum TaxID=1144873 RepID=A0A4R7AW59_9NEIS|nr:energy-coupling factor transporter transmembrane component T [Paludibacterium purpuratum]TDR71594.1 energy-coupling factor transport system permease protein [Paludibacterium purpuratum]
MKALSLYQDNGTLIHRVDPISKLLYIAAAIFIPVVLTGFTAGLAMLGLSLMLLVLARVLRKVVPLIGFSMLVLISVVIIQGLFYAGNRQVMFALGGVHFYREGLLFSAAICVRVLNILCAFALLVLTTRPSDLIESLVRQGLSPHFGYVLSSVLQIIPQMTGTMETITDAQRSRGMETEGSLMVRLRAFLPLIGPVVMNSLVSTRERSLALEVRAFSSRAQKTFLNEERVSTSNRVIKIVLLAAMAAAVAWRVVS